MNSQNVEHVAFVVCRGGHGHGIPACGQQGLTEDQYLAQLDRPDAAWHCPTCGGNAEYDDPASEEAQGIASALSGRDPEEDQYFEDYELDEYEQEMLDCHGWMDGDRFTCGSNGSEDCDECSCNAWIGLTSKQIDELETPDE